MSGGFLKSIGYSLGALLIFIAICAYVDGLSGSSGGQVAGGVDVETGEKLYWGDGQCSTCHKIGGQGSSTRGPDHENLFARAAGRAKERGLSSATEYLVESIVDPGAYVTEGFGNIMPKVFEPPILLNKDQILAVIMYMQTFGGDADVEEVLKFKEKIPSVSKKKVKPWAPPMAVGPEIGEGIFFSDTHPASCSKCHTAKGQGAKIGPELTNIGGVQTPEYLLESILNPSAVIVKGFETVFIMTTDGLPYTGIIKKQDGETIVLVVEEAGEMTEITLNKSEIQDMKQQEISMMPSNLSELLNVKDFYGVVNYLLTLK